MEFSQRYIVFDLETTGLSPRSGDLVIEIGAVAKSTTIIGSPTRDLIGLSLPNAFMKALKIFARMKTFYKKVDK